MVGILGLAVGCGRTSHSDTEADLPYEGFCSVRATFRAKCPACHDPRTHLGELDIETDPIGAMNNVPSSASPGRIMIVPGDPGASFLMVKLEGTQLESEGYVMPPGAPLDPEPIAQIREWILAGATANCASDSDTDVGPYHPAGWGEPVAHGNAALKQDQDCVTCHGTDLFGGSSSVSCETCHTPGWRTNCTYCHGGTENNTGAPPRDVLGETTPSLLSFPSHSAHLDPTRHPTYDCIQCHTKPEDVLSPGHFLVGDDTRGAVAEAKFSAGLAPNTTWNGTSCGTNYCHGNGIIEGTATVGQIDACTSCHADGTSPEPLLDTMSGEHSAHILGQGYGCSECHSPTVSNGQELTGPATHVNGHVEVSLPSGMQVNSQGCTGVCHVQSHFNQRW